LDEKIYKNRIIIEKRLNSPKNIGYFYTFMLKIHKKSSSFATDGGDYSANIQNIIFIFPLMRETQMNQTQLSAFAKKLCRFFIRNLCID